MVSRRHRRWIAAGVAAILVAGGVAWWLLERNRGPARPEAAVAAPSVLVRTQPLERRKVSETLDAFGEVLTAPVIGINFPHAGRVSRLWVTTGQQVSKDDRIATLQSSPSARAAYVEAVHAADLARRELHRVRQLYKLKLATRSQLDTARSALADAQAKLEEQKRLGGGVGAETVRAPADGVIVSIAVAQGDRVRPGAAIAQLGPVGHLRARLGLEPEDSRRVKPGMHVTLSPVADGSGKVEGKVAEVHDQLDPKTQLVDALVDLPAKANALLVPGMKVQGVITLTVHEAWIVPRQAVLTDAQDPYIFQVANGKAVRVPVTMGPAHDRIQEITGDFDTKRPVVVLGNYELKDGMAVREQPQ